jgi:hypothetical protein
MKSLIAGIAGTALLALSMPAFSKPAFSKPALRSSLTAQEPQSTPPRAATEDESRTNLSVFPASMAGQWKAAPFEVTLTSDYQESVYGKDARSVRQVDLTIRPSGEGTFTVVSSIRDRRGRTVPGTRQIEDVQFTVGDLQRETGHQPRYTSRIVRAERRYPDDPSYRFPLDGAKLELFVPEGKQGTLDVRFDTPEGRGSFWETLRRVTPAARRRTAP